MLELGVTAGLTAAFLWTVSSLLWRQVKLSPGAMNLSKNLLGVLLILLHLGIASTVEGTPAFTASRSSIGLIMLSGLFGIAIGDTLYFRCLQILGPRIALMLATTSPVFSVVLGMCFFNEQLSWLALVGILLTVMGLVVVLTDRAAAKEAPNLYPGKLAAGVGYGIAGALCQAIGGILSHEGSHDCSGLEAAVYRVAVGVVVVTLYYAFRKNLVTTVREVWKYETLKIVVPATVLGTWLGVWLSQVAYKYCDPSIAQTMVSTCPLFAVPLVWFFDRQRLSGRAVLGTLLAVTGVVLVIRYSG